MFISDNQIYMPYSLLSFLFLITLPPLFSFLFYFCCRCCAAASATTATSLAYHLPRAPYTTNAADEYHNHLVFLENMPRASYRAVTGEARAFIRTHDAFIEGYFRSFAAAAEVAAAPAVILQVYIFPIAVLIQIHAVFFHR